MTESARQCYICLDDEGEESQWVSPCRCAGTLKWVHQSCLIRWVREHESARPWSPAACPQCRTRLRLVPEKGTFVATLEFVDNAVYPACKYMAGWFFGLVAFDTACTTFGIIAQSQVYGLDETITLVKESDKLESLICLHLTSITLLVINSIPWERNFLYTLRKLSKMPGGKWFFPEDVPNRYRLPEVSSFSRIVVGSALLPFISRLVGNMLFSSVDSKLSRTILGGLTFLGVKGISFMYLIQKQEVRRKRMNIAPYPQNNQRPLS
jgi:E3 ubiquitin-protein ligase MARCH5